MPREERRQRVRALAEAGLSARSIARELGDTLHSLRHRAATGLVRLDVLVVGALLGHSDPASTAGYAAYSDARAVAAVRALDERHLGAAS